MSVTIYKCFIASPGDTQAEREACDKVFAEINKTAGHNGDFRIESWKWENDARPSFGIDGQDVVNKQVGQDYQLFIGIMYKRFGSPTSRAESGTEEEFNIAYEKHKRKEDVEIMMYFNDAPVNPRGIDLGQLEKVNQFKDRVTDLGGLYCEYNGVDDFAEKLRGHLYSFFREKKSLDQTEFAQTNKLEEALKNSVQGILHKRLDDALHNYSKQPIIWIDPVLSKSNDISNNPEKNYSNKIDVDAFVSNAKSTIIKSPPQFGLTCLAHYLVDQAWKKDKLWLYIDAAKAKPHSIVKSVQNEVRSLGLPVDYPVECIVLDSCTEHDEVFTKKANALTDAFPDKPLIIMFSTGESIFQGEQSSGKLKGKFHYLHLLALPKAQIRKMVSAYNKQARIAEEDKLLSKVVLDLSVLNIHRTPLNCLTLLKASEGNFDESPVNRTRMLELVLTVLFDMDNVPNYKTKPDLKDCEYVLGRFCEGMIRKEAYNFTRMGFLKELREFCNEKLIEVDVDVMFDVLESNSIIMQMTHELFCFRFSYWIYYFAAKRMHNDPAFAEFILTNEKYLTLSELIEFYTGVDRNRNDALLVLTKNIAELRSIVSEKVGLPSDMNPYHLAKWNPTEDSIIKIQKEIGEDVISSQLPDEVKDQYDDNSYDQSKPYNQAVQTVMRDYYLLALMNQISSCCRALRNSDFADADLKRGLFKEIVKGWEEMCKVLLALSPILASKGYANVGGAGFLLANGQDDTFENKLYGLIEAMPTNVVRFFKDDLSSDKIGPLIYDQINNETSDIRKHHIVIFLITERPSGWKNQVEKYIISIHKNSFYLYDTLEVLRVQCKYSFVDENVLREFDYLIRMCLAKHQYGEKKPGLDKLKKIPASMLPKRDLSEENDGRMF
ncbi:MAG: hypothetical protein ACRYFX_04680 [Janthinobacterium lividum]